MLNTQESLCVSRYLERYAESLVHKLKVDVVDEFESVIVIPIYDESQAQLERFIGGQTAIRSQSTLMIWVFNAPESSAETQALARTQKVFDQLRMKTQAIKLTSDIYIAKYQPSLSILLIDRCHAQLLPDKQGVGLARKLGMDIALKLIYEQYRYTQRWCQWIYSTDADAQLPESYATLPPKAGCSACIYPFKHVPESGFEKAMTEYEFSLHYYVNGLKQAGSPYAFHTIGSLIVVSSMAYAQVRGMPKRAGAEDFYVLNKLAKIGHIESLKEPHILLSGRPSHRVPFGTGPAIVKINAQHSNNQAFSVYHPRIFMLLGELLACVSEIEHSNAQEDILLSRLGVKLADPEEYEAVKKVLLSLGWEKQVCHLQKLKSTKAIQHAFHTWFDAFVTLRFIHELRDKRYPNILLTDLPQSLANITDSMAIRGTDFDYSAWFKALGI